MCQFEELRSLAPKYSPYSEIQSIVIKCKGDRVMMESELMDLWNKCMFSFLMIKSRWRC